MSQHASKPHEELVPQTVYLPFELFVDVSCVIAKRMRTGEVIGFSTIAAELLREWIRDKRADIDPEDRADFVEETEADMKELHSLARRS